MDYIYIDGGVRGNLICLVDGKERVLKKVKGRKTNNELEYLALLMCLEYIHRTRNSDIITIKSDSALVVNQVNGKWRSSGQHHLQILLNRAKKKMPRNVAVKWVPRERNLAGLYLDSLKGR